LPIGGYHGFKGFFIVLASFSWFFTRKNPQKLFLLIPDEDMGLIIDPMAKLLGVAGGKN
jgi:hypothetical protein